MSLPGGVRKALSHSALSLSGLLVPAAYCGESSAPPRICLPLQISVAPRQTLKRLWNPSLGDYHVPSHLLGTVIAPQSVADHLSASQLTKQFLGANANEQTEFHGASGDFERAGPLRRSADLDRSCSRRRQGAVRRHYQSRQERLCDKQQCLSRSG